MKLTRADAVYQHLSAPATGLRRAALACPSPSQPEAPRLRGLRRACHGRDSELESLAGCRGQPECHCSEATVETATVPARRVTVRGTVSAAPGDSDSGSDAPGAGPGPESLPLAVSHRHGDRGCRAALRLSGTSHSRRGPGGPPSGCPVEQLASELELWLESRRATQAVTPRPRAGPGQPRPEARAPAAAGGTVTEAHCGMP